MLLLTALSFCLGWTLVLVDTAAMALFLSTLGAAALPGVYLGAAVAVPLAGVAVGWLGQRLLPERLAAGALLLFGGLLVLLWAGSAVSPWAFFALLLWYRAFNALAGVLFWGVAGRLLNLRQTKRLYGTIGSGENVARVLGYALVPLLIAWLGVANLLALAAIGLAGALAIAVALGRLTSHVRPAAPATPPGRPISLDRLKGLLANPYPLLILAIIALSSWAFSTLDLAFATQLEQRFSDAEQLAGFLAGLALILSVARLVGRPLLTGPLLGRYGIAMGLLAQPVVMVAGMALVLAGLAAGPAAVFWLVAAIRLLDSALSTVLSRPTLQVLLQPLPAGQRLATQSFADGVVSPLALGAIGLVGLSLNAAGVAVLAALALALGIVWAVVAAQARRAYLRALGRSLTRRFSAGDADSFADPAALALVRRALDSPHRGEVLYAIELLAARMPVALVQARPALLAHPDPVVRRATLGLVAAGSLAGDQAELERLLASEADVPTRAAAISALCTTGEADAVEAVAPYVDDPAPEVRRAAMVGLLRHGGIVGILAAGPRLVALVGSLDPGERILAAGIAGELGSPDYFQPLRPLFADPSRAVRRAVLIAAGQVRSARLVPRQLEALADPGTAAAAAYSLELTGAVAIPALVDAFAETTGPARVAIAGILGRVGGEQARATLRAAIGHPDPELRLAVYKGLEACGFTAARAEQPRVRAELLREAGEAAWLLAAAADLDAATDALLAEALAVDLGQCRARILHLLAFLGDAQAVAAARASLAQGAPEQRAYAVEIIDVLLPAAQKPAVLILFDDLTPAVQLQRLRAYVPQPALGRAARLAELAGDTALPVGLWARACARYSLALARHNGAGPPDHGGEVAAVGRVAALRGAELFAGTPGATLAELAERMVAMEVPAGATIFAQGDVGDALYIVVAGAVRIFVGAQTLNTMGPGQVFGEMAVLDPAPRVASAQALEVTRLLRLDRRDLEAIFDERPEVMRPILRTITRNLRANVATLADLRVRLAA